MVFHPHYDPVTEDNDVALLRLKRPILMSAWVQPIALPGAEATSDCRDDDEEEGIALRRARRECRRKQMEDGEVFSQDGDHDYYEGNIEDDHHIGGQNLDS